MAPPPSGRQTVLVHGDQQAVVVEVGGGLRSYTVGGFEVLDGYGVHERCSSGRGQPLFPWPNRLDGGAYRFGPVSEQAPLSEPAAGNAIHGLTRWAPWSLRYADVDHATTGFTLRPQPGWAWTLDLQLHYRLDAAGLSVTMEATNRSEQPCPFGAGFHPYLVAPSGRVDDLVLTVPAGLHDVADERGIPFATEPVAGSAFDFSDGRAIDDAVLDVAFSALRRDGHGRATVVVADPGSGRDVSVHLGPGFDYVMVFTGDTVGARARQGLAVEPMTGPANLLRSGRDLITLEPDVTWRAEWALAPGWL